MSLLSESFEKFVIVTKTAVTDGEGGETTVYTDGTEFFGIANAPKSSVRQTADAPSSETSYVITTKKETILDFYAIIKRVSDGAYFRIVSDSVDNVTPVSSPLGIRQYSAEKWRIPT